MHNPVRMILYSSSAILLLVLLWGFRQIPQQGLLADQALRESLNQEMVVLTGAVKSATQAMKYRLLDVLKAEGNDRPTRTFQDSPFIAAALLEWDQVQWKTDWFSVKNKSLFQNGELKDWVKDWPLSKLGLEEVFYTKVADIQGQPYFAIVVPVRKPNQIPMIGIGIFPANQFGMSLSAEENREMRVFTLDGFALALSHPAYLGSSLKNETLVNEALTGGEVSLRHDWKSERGRMFGVAERIAESNLMVAIETAAQPAPVFSLWIYLLMCAIGAALLNWVLFKGVFGSVLNQLEQTENTNEQLRRMLNERPQAREEVKIEPVRQTDPTPEAVTVEEEKIPATAAVPVAVGKTLQSPELSTFEFSEDTQTEIEVPATGLVNLERVVNASLRALDGKIKERGINVLKFGLDELHVSGDSLQLQTAVEEILKNSIEAMEDGGKRDLTISGREDKNVIHITVQDSGRGIPSTDVQKVFDPFFSTKDSEGVARGLGLNVVRRVVEEMHGRVSLSSCDSGSAKGTKVEISFPINAEAAVAFELDFTETEEEELVPQPAAKPVTVAADEMPPPLRWDIIRKPRMRNLN